MNSSGHTAAVCHCSSPGGSPAKGQLSSTQSAAYEPLLALRDLAAWFKVSEHTVRKWAACGPESGKLPRSIRLNGQLRWRREDVIDFLASKEDR